jgi:membrane associated rhomboid family serine protease
MGRVRYPIFYLLGGSLAFVAQTLVDPASTISTLGASCATAASVPLFSGLFSELPRPISLAALGCIGTPT